MNVKVKGWTALKCLLLLLAFVVQHESAKSQIKKNEAWIYGAVLNRLTGETLVGVNATLMKTDSTVIATSVTSENGLTGSTKSPWSFVVPKEQADYIIKFSKEGFETVYRNITYVPKKASTYVFFDKTYMLRVRERKLGTAMVTATRVKFYTKKDTLVFNADAFQMAEGSMLDALIKQLPGVELKDDGQIFVNGKYVESLLLNGENFFDRNRNVMLENLPTYMVNNVKVYEKQGKKSILTGHEMDDKEYVMDVHLKKQYSIGWIANAEGAAGTDDRYLGRFFALRFTRQSRLSFYGNINNINETRKPGQNGDWSPSNVAQGQKTHKAFGADYQVKDRKSRFDISGWAEVGHDDITSIAHTTSENFLPAGNEYGLKSSWQKQCVTDFKTRHNWNFKNDHTSFSVTPYLYYGRTRENGFDVSANFNRDWKNTENLLDSVFSGTSETLLRSVINRYKNRDQVKKNNLYTTTNLHMMHRPKGIDAAIEALGFVEYQDKSEKRFNHYTLDRPAAGSGTSDFRNRYYNTPAQTISYYGQVNFWYWLGRSGFSLMPSYKYRGAHVEKDNDIYRLEQLAGWGSDADFGALPSEREYLERTYDAGNSFNRDQKTYEHTFDFCIRYNHEVGKGNLGAYLGMPVRLTKRTLDYKRAMIDTLFSKSNTDFSPKANIRYNWHNWSRSVELSYNMSTKLYDLVQTLDVRSDDNPLNVTLGNGALKNAVTHKASLSYTNNSSRKQRFFSAGVDYSAVRNQIGYSSEYNRATGVYTYRPVNVNGNYTIAGNVNYSMVLDKKRRWNLSTATTAQLYNNVDIITVTGADENPRSKVKTFFLGETVKVDYRLGRQEIGAKLGCNWRNATSAREDFATVNAANFNYGLTGQFELTCGFQLFTDLTMYSRRGYEAHEMNTDELVWNARLSKQVWKKRLTLALEGFDILHNLSAVTHTLNGQGRTETYRNVIPSYGMLHVIYRLNVQPKKK